MHEHNHEHGHTHTHEELSPTYGTEDVEYLIDVAPKSASYKVHVGLGTFDKLGEIVREVTAAKRVLVISDTTVASLYGEYAIHLLQDAEFEAYLSFFEAGEASKHFGTLESLLDAAASCNLNRHDAIVALGGGVVGDMAGMVAGLYMRGISVIQLPTSLLAMVDSSVGGKCAVDLEAGKNLAGLFLQPKAVIADIDCLDTIDEELLQDSMGEVIKHAVLADPALFRELCEHNIIDPDFDRQRLAKIVARNIEIKRDIVEADEFERGERAKLNLGHSFGHAIEAANNFELGHGSSVSAGLCIMARAAAKKGFLAPEAADAIESCTSHYGLPTTTDISAQELMHYIEHDKKMKGEKLRVVIPREIGKAELYDLTLDEVRELLELGL